MVVEGIVEGSVGNGVQGYVQGPGQRYMLCTSQVQLDCMVDVWWMYGECMGITCMKSSISNVHSL